MAMSISSLKGKIHDYLVAEFGAAADDTELQKYANAIAKAVFEEVTQNAVVQVASVSGVTPGGGTSGPGTGTVT